MVAIGQLIEPGLQLQSVLSSCGLRQRKKKTSCIDSLKLDYSTVCTAVCSDHVPRRWPFVVAGSSTHSVSTEKGENTKFEPSV